MKSIVIITGFVFLGITISVLFLSIHRANERISALEEMLAVGPSGDVAVAGPVDPAPIRAPHPAENGAGELEERISRVEKKLTEHEDRWKDLTPESFRLSLERFLSEFKRSSGEPAPPGSKKPGRTHPAKASEIARLRDPGEFVDRFMAYYSSRRCFSESDYLYQNLVSRGQEIVPFLVEALLESSSPGMGHFAATQALKVLLGPEDEKILRDNLAYIPELASVVGKFQMAGLEPLILEILGKGLAGKIPSYRIRSELFDALVSLKSTQAIPVMRKYVEKGPGVTRYWAAPTLVKLSDYDPGLVSFLWEEMSKVKPGGDDHSILQGFIEALLMLGDERGIDRTLDWMKRYPDQKGQGARLLVRYVDWHGAGHVSDDQVGEFLDWLARERNRLVWDLENRKFVCR